MAFSLQLGLLLLHAEPSLPGGAGAPGTRAGRVRHGSQGGRRDLRDGVLIAFSRDGTLSACPTASGEVCLLDPISGEELATLARAGPATIVTSLAFSPDGGTLAASTTNNLLVLWDLRRVRDDLRGFGLDWDGRALPPGTSPAGTSRLRITVTNEPVPPPSAAELEKELVRCGEMMAAGPPDAVRSGR